MGITSQYRQRIRTQANSVEGKGFTEYLASHIKVRREVSLDEAYLIARDVKDYLDTQMLMRPLGQIEMPVIEGAECHIKRSRAHQPEKLVNLTVIADDDVELMRDFGIECLQNGRIARVIEEAYHQDGSLDRNRLQVLFLMNYKAIHGRLNQFWEKGCILPLAGMNRSNREKMQKFRAVIAVERYLEGEDLKQIQRDLAFSQKTWRQWWLSFRQVIILGDMESKKISEVIGEPVGLIEQWQETYRQMKDLPSIQRRLDIEELQEWEQPAPRRRVFRETLLQRHGFSPAAADAFIDELHEMGQQLTRESWKPGEIGYIAISADEGPGRSLAESELVLCHLEYLAREDWDLVHRDQSWQLKWARLQRLATQAYYQGATLTQPDLAFIMSCSVEAIRKSMYKHSEIVLPTRGRVVDMGPTISHAEKIIRFWMDGYTETEIVRRTGHSIESIERYLLDFARIMLLLEKKMPVSAIRTVMGTTRKLVERYVSLYNEYNGTSDGWRLGQLRRMGEAHSGKKKLHHGKGRVKLCRKVITKGI